MDNISLVTYAGQTVTPLDDALVYETAINQSGMIYGGTVTIKSANNLHISSGHGIVCGRKFTIFDSDIQVALSSSGTLLGRLYVQLDLSNVGTPIQLLVETGASLTPVQQDNNVNIMNGVFEFNIATFTVDTSTISNVIMVAPSAEPSTGAGSVITVTTAEASLAGKMCTITDGTTTLNANFDNTGKAVFYGVQMVGRVLVNATDGEYYASGEVNITYFGLYSTSIAFWGATINLSTTTPEFYGQNITVEQDGILVSTISFDGTGHATYIAPALGVYDFTVTYGGNEYTATVNVTEETTYSKSIDIAPAGLDLSSWITAGSTTDYPLNPSSYADFAALEADEAAVRQLMTVHDAVDYLATATAGDTLMQSVINSDVCAKWINLSDYALDTLYANSDIADVMDTADKYGYGEWGIVDSTTTPPTWGALGCVPIMTANNAPYGVASAYQVFDGNSGTSASGTDFSYQSVNPICVKKFECSVNGGTLQGSNDGSTYTNISDPSSNTTYYMYHKVHFASSQTVHTLQFYGRELKPLVPTMTGNTTPKGEVIYSTQYSSDIHAAWHVFVSGASSSWSPAASDSYGNAYIGYHAPAKCKALMAYVDSKVGTNRLTKYKIQASNDKFATTPVDVSSVIDNDVAKYIDLSSSTGYDDYRILLTQGGGTIDLATVYNIQFYGSDYSEKEFASGSTAKWIYDHGVELETLTISGTGTKGSNAVTLSANGATATASITFTSGTWNTLNGKTGLNASGSPRIVCGSGYAAITDRASLDVSAITGANNTGASQTGSGTVDIEELYLE